GSGKLHGGAALVKQGTGSLILDNTGSNDFSGGLNIVGGTVQFGNNDANGNLPVSGGTVDNGTLIFNRTDSYTVANVISGNGTVTQTGSGTNKLAVITNGGTLDIENPTTSALSFTNASDTSGKQFYIAGAGVGGNGAIVNNGTASQLNAFQNITLTANATVGGPARWDMRVPSGHYSPILDLGGFTLTKTGS